MVAVAKAPGGDVHQLAGLDAGAGAGLGAVADGGSDFLDARDEHLADELAGAGLGESGKGNALSGIGAGVDDEHGLAARLDVLDVAERVLGTDHGNDAQAGEVHPLPRALFNGPREDGFLAVGAHLGIGETRAGVDIARAHLEIGSADGGGWLGPDGGRQKNRAGG